MPIVVGIVLFCSLFFPKSVFAANIVINEFSSASSPEWVELYNTSDQETSLKDVIIFFDDNSTTSQKLIFCDNDKISAKSYKRIDPISSFSWLSNTGDTLILKQGDDIIDSISYGTGKTLKAPLATQSGARSPDGTSNWILAVPNPQGDVSNFNCPEPVAEISQSVTPAPTFKIEWSLEDKVYVGRDFKTTKLELSNFDGNTEYYLKLRAGTEEGKLTKIQTKNGSAYLSDGESWSKFPLIKTDENSKWTGEIKGLLSEGKSEGKYKILVRIRKKDTESFYESDTKEIDFLKVSEEIIVIATPAAVIKSVEKMATKPAVISVKKSTQSAVLGSSVAENNSPQKANPLAVVLGVSGFFLLLFSVWGIIIKRYGSQ